MHTLPPVPSPRAEQSRAVSANSFGLRNSWRRTEITALDHEVLDDTVELRALVAKALRELRAILLHPGCEGAEVLRGLGDSLLMPRPSVTVPMSVRPKTRTPPYRPSTTTHQGRKTRQYTLPLLPEKRGTHPGRGPFHHA